ncbi:DUF2975 domain-containing protein [Asticcacaulis benevestitus]|uniref:DUF2975 domain-containing protein n=1 Tax=Asticcacaulis benevestitus DSM 16100 = ATCC BAA-896 TaxID=1121022 RepID=V4P3F8_9CAUL|nr:DUF2975 domain-containing protein [Asticcacaulis benevestitus]ESQ82616.1 hypothetical protein ABENE_20885 [Asticcacaulis benevestitus DSM 16100 = ATCC BAA-896]
MQDDIRVLQGRSRWLTRLALTLFGMLLLALAIEAAMIVRADDQVSALGFWLSYRLSMLFYLSAIWTMHRAFARIASGELFNQVLPVSLSRLGFALAGGAVTSVFISPWLGRVLGGFRHGAFAAFDPPAITIGLVGLLLVVLSGLFARAVAMRHELDEII